MLAPLLTSEPEGRQFLSSVSIYVLDHIVFHSLIERDITSLRMTMEVDFIDVDANTPGAEDSTYLTFGGRNGISEIEKLLEKTEVELLFGPWVANGIYPVPCDKRVVQADNTRGISPPTTYEAVQKAHEESHERYLASVRYP